jgi:hypothetical protein
MQRVTAFALNAGYVMRMTSVFGKLLLGCHILWTLGWGLGVRGVYVNSFFSWMKGL